MLRRPPRYTRTDTLCPYTTLFRSGRIVENVDLVRAAEPGKDLTLSIDRRIQYLTYRELKRALLESGADSASAVVLDVHTGEVLAMANLPSFNPNAVESGQRASHRNRAVTDLIEPGSTLKPLTVAAALEAGVVTPDTLDRKSTRLKLQSLMRISYAV